MAASRRCLTLACTLVMLGALSSGCDRVALPAKPAFHGIDITGADYAREFNLPDAEGRARTLADFKGKVVVVFFGYTQCPDVCPTTLAELVRARKLLGADGTRVQPVFITLDPERDSADVLRAYVASFGDDVVALRGKPDEIRAAAKQFKVFFSKVPGKTDTSYTIDHTAGSYVFDPQGRIRLFTRHGAGADSIAGDLKLLLAGG